MTRKPASLKKGIDRAIKNRGYKMEAHVHRGEVIIRK